MLGHCCSVIKITLNFKLKLVFIEKTTARKETYKLLQETTSNLKHKQKRQGFYMVSGVLMHFLLSDIFQLSYQVGEVDRVLQLIFLKKVNFLQVYNKLKSL